MNILIILGHPNFTESKANKALLETVKSEESITVHNVSEVYPDGKINVAAEQKLVEQYDRIIFQFPTYWLGMPSVMKEWIDSVFTVGWAHGEGGTALHGKEFGVATTTGSPKAVYQKDGSLGHTIEEILVSMMITANYVGAKFIGISALYGAFAWEAEEIARAKEEYKKMILK